MSKKMISKPVVICLPTGDRQTSFTFYRDGLGFKPIGEPAEDGVPEPLQFALNEGIRIMLIPTSGFDWVTGNHKVAAPGHSECLLSFSKETDAEVNEVVERAQQAGAEIVIKPGKQRWGYAGAFADLDGHVWQVMSEAQSD